MRSREIALTFLDHFCAGDVAGLAPLLAADLRFSGTLHQFACAADYLDSLSRDPPERCAYRVLSVTDAPGAVALFYELLKPGQTLSVAQLFEFRGRQIAAIRVIFDASGFSH